MVEIHSTINFTLSDDHVPDGQFDSHGMGVLLRLVVFYQIRL